MLVDASIQSLAKAINASWRKTTDSVLDTAKLCANAEENLESDERDELIELLDCSSPTFSKLVKIGKRPELQSDPIKSLLPVSYSIVYEIAKLNQVDLVAAVEEGIINHKMTRADIAVWLAERHGAGVKTSTEIKPIVIGTLQLPHDYDGTRQIQLEKDLEKLRAKYGFSLERPLNSEGVAFDRMGRDIDYDIRKEARQFIKKLKSHRLNKSLVKLSAAEKKKLWPYAKG